MLGLFIFSCLSIYSAFFLKDKLTSPQYNIPKSSDGEINIISPENKTYVHPDNGYYPATYGFENVINGQDHPDWNDGSSQKGNIISEMDGHKKVYEVTDNSGSGAADLYEYYDIQSHGTIEFWCRFSSAIEGNFYQLRKEGPITLGPTLNIYLNQFTFTNSSGGFPIPGAPIPQVNTWYHIRFVFRGSYSSEYSGLTSRYTYFIYINMIRYGPFNYEDNADVGTFRVHTSIAGSGFKIWWDAVGYSWDPNYNIGDNLNEGFLLSYDNTTTLDWEGYSLDGASNKTIMGNTVIPFPTDGHHKIQFFGNDSFGNSYKSDLRYFSVDSTLPYISINAPLQHSYFSWDAPYFQVTISGDNISSTSYRIGDSEILFDTSQGKIKQVLWDNCTEGLVSITFNVSNTVGNYSIADITVHKDTILPFITTQFSYEGNSYDQPPYFFLTISDANLDLKWFTINDDPTKHYLAGQNLGFSNELWYNLDDGVITLTIYAIDKAGNENYYDFYVIKDVYGDYPYTPEPYNPPYYPSFIAITIGGIILLGIIVTILVIFGNKNTQARSRTRYYGQRPYQPPPVETKRYEYSSPKRLLKCPYCSYEEDVDGNFCPQCGARLRGSEN